jgi:hypothetical protein
MTRPNADTGDVPAHTIGLGFDAAALAAAEASEERAWRAAVASAQRGRSKRAK